MPNSQLAPVHRYLWAQGAVDAPLAAGSYLAQRYQVLQFPLLRDTQPQLPPSPLTTVPAAAEPYLALSPFSTTVPRPFTQVMHPDGNTPLLLLEEVPLQGVSDPATPPALLPTLATVWSSGSGLEQLSWLWQLAKLWAPCCEQQVAHCLLDEDTVRVDREDLRLLTLEVGATAPTLAALGKYWQGLVDTAAPAIRDYLTQLVDHLMSGQLQVRELVYSLVQALEQQSAQRSLRVELATASDQGPTRQRNEDACFPPSGTAQAVTLAVEPDQGGQPAPLVVVCDGVGGHEGGDVASHSAIAEVTQQLNALLASDRRSHSEIVTALRQAMLAANQVIAERNDADHRQDRGRMGTTIVMALVYGGRLYVAHLGDSRAYRVRSHNCRQITLDDDVAAREMRLGLELYQDALQNPGSGALVQALGMASANYLHPTVKLFPIAADSLILLCSDGLSDHDLVDRLWTSELLPVLQGDRPVADAAPRLISLANTHNGHDNVTVGLLRLSPQPLTAIAPVPVELVEPSRTPVTAPPATVPVRPAASPTTTRMTSPPTTATPPAKKVLPLLVTSMIVAGIVGISSALAWQWWSRRAAVAPPTDPDAAEGETLSPSAAPPTAQSPRPDALTVGDYWQIQQVPDPSTAATLMMTNSPPAASLAEAVDAPRRVLSVGSVVQVRSRQQTPAGELWVRLAVCSAPTAQPTSPEDAAAATTMGDRRLPLAVPGEQGWLLQSTLPTLAEPLLDTSSTQQGLCID